MKTLTPMDHFYIRSVGELADQIARTAEDLGRERVAIRQDKFRLEAADAESAEGLRKTIRAGEELVATYEQSIARTRAQIAEYTRAAILGE
jgi:hypothetical protein